MRWWFVLIVPALALSAAAPAQETAEVACPNGRTALPSPWTAWNASRPVASLVSAPGGGEAGFAPCFSAALAAGRISMTDATCPAIHTMLQAAEKGVPFMPLRGVLGSDILAHRPDWKVIDNPFADGGDPIVLLPALQPDIAAFHGVMADEEGNVFVGRRRELRKLLLERPFDNGHPLPPFREPSCARLSQVPPAGFEPAISGLKGRCPRPLDDGGRRGEP